MNSIVTVDKAKEIIHKQCQLFLSEARNISNTLPYLWDIRTVQSDFPILFPDEGSFFRFRSLEWGLERLARDYLITNILDELLYEAKVDYKIYVENEHLAHATFRYDLEEFGRFNDFVFIIYANSETVGYRYSHFNLSDKEVLRLLKRNQINRYEIIDFSGRNHHYSNKNRNEREIPLSGFFEEYFNQDIYNEYLITVKHAIRSAFDELGFLSIPNYSNKNASLARINLMKSLYEFDYQHAEYVFSSDEKVITNKFSEKQYELLDQRFKKEGRYLAICGNTDFAKSFLTSEYLYSVFTNGNSFDYTSIVAGYLKSVEQLMYLIYEASFRGKSKLHDVKRCIKKTKQRDNYEYFDDPYDKENYCLYIDKNYKLDKTKKPEFGSLLSYLRYRDELWAIDEDGKEIIYAYLDDYRQYCRNEHFHKDNIENYDVVIKIRNNAYICLYCLLGGFIILEGKETEHNLLKISNYGFEQFYNAIQKIPRSQYRFLFIMPDGSTIRTIRLDNQPLPDYKERLESTLDFYDIESFKDFNWEDDLSSHEVISFNKDYYPCKGWLVLDKLETNLRQLEW